MRTLVYIVTILALVAFAVSADTPDGGLQSPFSLGAGARELALGGSVLPTVDAVVAPYWNASRLATAEHYSFGAFHSRLFDSDVAYQYIGVVVPTMDFGGFGFGVFRLGVSGIEKRDEENLLLGEIDDNRMGFYLAYGRSLSGYDVGASISMENHTLGDYSATSSPGLTISVGRMFNAGMANISDVHVTAVSRNLISPSTELADVSVEQPISAELGLSTVVLPNRDLDQRLTMSMSLTKVESIAAELAMGLEYNFQDMLFIRGGLRDDKLCFGAGVTYSVVDFDYALVGRDLGSLHMFSITTAFGRSVSERRKVRLEKREAQFARMMEERMNQQNKSAVSQLRAQGEKLLDLQDFDAAAQCFDKALFMARAAGEDTTEVATLLRDTQYKLEELIRENTFSTLMDSARHNYNNERYMDARYFARQALEFAANPDEVTGLLGEIDGAIERAENTEEMIRTQLWLADSLVSYGEFDRALQVLSSLREFAPDDKNVWLATRKVLFEQECERATSNFESMNYPNALAHVDSALVLMPGHRWCRQMRDQIVQEQSRKHTQPQRVEQPKQPPLTAAVLDEVKRHYKSGQVLFADGDLQSAVREWEKVVALAPDYMSVRDYLVKAYKFLGVELYGQNQLVAAIDSWKKAVTLDSGNAEIIDYIQRAENEIRKLKELSYEPGN